MSLSPLRAQLASYENAYQFGARRRAVTGRMQFVVRTDNPLQPFRVTTVPPRQESRLATVIT